LDLSDDANKAKLKLQALSHHLFEELASDVYDEVDRRECDAGIAFKYMYFLWYIALHFLYQFNLV